ncbi:hypothetical protein [Psychromonas sp. MME2]|uniref:hypothetical protein n=1 Tax=unclassified Psychromonas TaxID=2614957 RepID=UPI00339C0848
MGTKSVNAMLSVLSSTPCLQSIVAASFDESDDTFRESTNGISNFKLIKLPRKIINLL